MISSRNNQYTLNLRYKEFSEDFIQKRYKSTTSIRAKVHNTMLNSAVNFFDFSDNIIDLGCGDGYGAELFSLKGLKVTAIDISIGNIKAAKSRTKTKFNGSLLFKVGNACKSGYPNRYFTNSFSHHVLEHLHNFNDGLLELKRISDKYILIAVPSPWSPLAWTLLGGGNYWNFNKWSMPRVFLGLSRTLIAWILHKDGVNEHSYSSLDQVPHIFYFPGRLKRILGCPEWKVIKFHTQVKGLPWINSSIKASTIKNKKFGLGIIFLLERVSP